jgi:hypothetical protein
MTRSFVTVVIESEQARAAFLAWARQRLRSGEVLVQIRDLHGRRRAFRTVPRSPGAILVATEAPLLLQGGLTQSTTYYSVPTSELDAMEIHSEGGVETHWYDSSLRVACRALDAPRVPA